MKRSLNVPPIWAVVGLVAAETLCAGVGMGVPIFCILLGLPVGWAIARLLLAGDLPVRDLLSGVLRYAVLTSAFILLLLAAIWGWGRQPEPRSW